MLGAIYIGHSSPGHVHNLMKSQLYTYLGRKDIRRKTTMHFGSLVWTPNPIMAYGSYAISRDGPEKKMAATLKVHK